MFLGDNQHVGRRLRMDVFKRKDVFVFKDFLGGNLAVYDSAKQAIIHKNLVLGVRY
jgi:hypothetical protein